MGIGVDNICLEYCKNRGITVMAVPNGPTQAVAEHTIGLMLALLRHTVDNHASMLAGAWEPKIGKLLCNQTVGVIGLGRIGCTVVRLLRAFGAKVIGNEIEENQFNASLGLAWTSPIDLLLMSNIVSLHVPLTESTRHMIDDVELAWMRPGTLLVNTARGYVVNEGAVYSALQSGHLGAYAVDVFAHEPYASFLCGCPNVLMTPHIAGCTEETWEMMRETAIRHCNEALNG